REARLRQRLLQCRLVVEELVSPSSERAIEIEAAADRVLRCRVQFVVCDPDPVEIRSGEAEHAVIAQRAAAFTQQLQPVGIREMLDEELGEDELHVVERQLLCDVEHLVDAGIALVVDVDPALVDDRTAAEVEFRHGWLPVTAYRLPWELAT